MNPFKSILIGLRNYANFAGYSRYGDFFWFFALFYFIQLCVHRLITVSPELLKAAEFAWMFLLIPALAVTARRLHTVGKWRISALFMLFPIFGIIIAFVALSGRRKNFHYQPVDYLHLGTLLAFSSTNWDQEHNQSGARYSSESVCDDDSWVSSVGSFGGDGGSWGDSDWSSSDSGDSGSCD